jgi:hypothetical protein
MKIDRKENAKEEKKEKAKLGARLSIKQLTERYQK